jgi:hypothetical protein
MAEQVCDAKRIFLEAVENHTPQQWPQFLDDSCEGDNVLRGNVEALLKAHSQPNPILDVPGFAGALGSVPICRYASTPAWAIISQA